MSLNSNQVDLAGFPGVKWLTITPSDSVAQPAMRAIHTGGTSGTIIAKGEDGTAATFAGVAGTSIGISPAYVMTSSTATGLIAIVK